MRVHSPREHGPRPLSTRLLSARRGPTGSASASETRAYFRAISDAVRIPVFIQDTQATPVMAQDVIRRIREVTDKPIRYVMLSHYHAVRVLGASAYQAEHIIASEATLELIRERGASGTSIDVRSDAGSSMRRIQVVTRCRVHAP